MPTSPSRPRGPIVALVVLVLLGVGAGIIWRLQPGWLRGAKYSVEETRALVEQKNIARAHMENADIEKSIAEFAALAQKLPQEKMPVQNQLLVLLWALRDLPLYKSDPARRAAALEQAAALLARLREISDDAPMADYFEARLALEREDQNAALAALQRAAAADPKNVLFPALIYEILSVYGDASTDEEELRQLETAWRLQPGNLHLVRELAYKQAEKNKSQAEKDPSLADTLDALRKAFAPFRGTVKDQAKFDIGPPLDAAQEAVRKGDWAQAFGLVANVYSVTVSLPAHQFDQWRLNPHELEFAVNDFGPEFYAEAEFAPLPAPEAIPVHFAPAPAAWKLPELADALAVRLADFDLDGRWDVIVLRPQRVEVYGRDAANAAWVVLAAAEVPSGMTGILTADLDRDIRENYLLSALGAQAKDGDDARVASNQCVLADVDLIVYGGPGVRLLKNVYDPQTNSRTLQAAEDPPLAALQDVRSANVADVDHDGDLDLVVSSAAGMSLWSNRENFTFDDITPFSAAPPPEFAVTSIVPVDWDRNVYLDLVLGNAAGEAGVWTNYGHRNFRWEPFESSVPAAEKGSASNQEEVPARQAGPTLAVLDADRNVAWDVLAARADGVSLTMNTNPRAGVVQPLKTTRIGNSPVGGLLTFDYDNDGLLDLLTRTADSLHAWRGLPEGEFQPRDDLFREAPNSVRNAHAADFDQDGDLDLLFETSSGPALFLNDGGNANRWLTLRLGADLDAQTPRERTNMHGLGSLVEVKAGQLYQARVADGQIMHFGLGKRERADLVRVLWTNGIPQNVLDPATDQTICVEQKLKGSCPFIYVWDGKQWRFYTDCLWSAPLGLQFARGVLAPAREWEYLTVSGDALAEDDGEYRLMMTEELWEAAYFDEIRLIAVDHPADVEIFSNEKVGPAEIAEFRIHTVRHPRTPAAAYDHRGRDVLDSVARSDKKFVQLFESGHRQGLVEPHYLELDLGRLDNPRQFTLFLRGWTWPTDTSINVALDENPDLAGPQPPSLWVPNAAGEWIEAIPYLGFPGGKTKTIAVDISDVFPAEDYRVRIKTSMEIYWDSAFFSLDEQTDEIRQQPAPLVSANLVYRGFSQRGPRLDNGPESYDAARCDLVPNWPPMLGRFTRYGDATELIRERDDRLAVLGAGDALEMRFAPPANDPPPGWKRDFLLYNVGWDKDADLNTVTGQTVEPLPFGAMRQYPTPPDQAEPDTPAGREYLRNFQIREQPRAPFWRYVHDFSPGNEGER